jgi:uncharacterized protein
MMKAPCEIIARHVLPPIRRALIKDIVLKHNLTQAQVARRFGVTDATVSMYMNSKRGSFKEIEDSRFFEEFRVEVSYSAERIVGGSDVATEVCRLCKIFRNSNTFIEIYEKNMGEGIFRCSCQNS